MRELITAIGNRDGRYHGGFEVALSTRSDSGTIGGKIRIHAERQPDHVAVVSSTFAPLSYRQLQSLIEDARAALRGAGFGRSARIAIVIPSGPEAALAIVAVACSAVSIPLNPRQTIRETEVWLSALRPNAVLVLRGSDSVVRRLAEREGIKIIEVARSDKNILDFTAVEREIDIATELEESDEPDPNAAAFIFQSSGTTSEPKMIPFSHRNMLAAAARVGTWFHLTPNDRCLSVSPIFYSHGLKVTVFTPLLTGGTVAFPTDPTKFDLSEWFGSLKPTWYSAGPTLHRLVLDQVRPSAEAKAGHSLRFILSGGAQLPRNVQEDLQRALDVPVVEHYGSSEAAQIAINLPPPGRSKPGTCGVPWPDTVMIVGEDGLPVPQGEQGEILVGGPTLISGYLNAPELNRKSFHNGWFSTGDIGSLDEDGFLTLHGRKNDIINRGGEKISPNEIDNLLLRHPAVAEAAAFSVPHPRLGEDVAAAVVLRPGAIATPGELRAYLQEQLSSFKVPGRIVIRDQLPKGKTGKILRRELSGIFETKAAPETLACALPSSENTPSGNTVVDKTLVLQLTELWERLLQIQPIALDDDFGDKGGDSLLAMEMLSEVELLTGVAIPSSILFEARTIRQLAAKLVDRASIGTKPLIKINRSGGQTPLLLFHGDYGGGLYAARLANLLGADQPIFIISPHGLNDEAIPSTIKEMAADRLTLIVDAQPKGPYRLCGYCNGAIVAFEVARMLLAAGEKVDVVAMIDYPTVSAHRIFRLFASVMGYARPIIGSIADRAPSWIWHRCLSLEGWLNLRARERLDLIYDNIRKCFVRSGESPNEINHLGGLLSVPLGMHRALGRHSPAPLPVPVIYFSAEYGSLAWKRLSSENVTMIRIGKHHGEIIRNPANLAIIAHHLKARLRTLK